MILSFILKVKKKNLYKLFNKTICKSQKYKKNLLKF